MATPEEDARVEGTEDLGAGAEAYAGLDKESGQEVSQDTLDALAANAAAAGIEGLSEVIKNGNDEVQRKTAEMALALIDVLSRADSHDIRAGGLLVSAAQGQEGDPVAEALANNAYALVGVERPDKSAGDHTVKGTRIVGGGTEADRPERREWRTDQTAIEGVGILELDGFHNDGSFYVNLYRSRGAEA